jgi:hypothetical protein
MGKVLGECATLLYTMPQSEKFEGMMKASLRQDLSVRD